MKLNIAYPTAGTQKTFAIDDDHKLLPFFEKRMGAEVAGDSLGDQFKGYTFKITGGNDKQGFPMKQGILCDKRMRILFKQGMSCYRERRKGSLKRKSVRGCIVGSDLAIMNLVVVQHGDTPLEGVTDADEIGRRLGPKRASKIRKMFDLKADDPVTKFVVRRTIAPKVEGGKEKNKAPKIQRLVTKRALQRKRRVKNEKKNKAAVSSAAHKAYNVRVHDHKQAAKEKRALEVAKKKKSKTTASK